jgi:ribosomal protein L28
MTKVCDFSGKSVVAGRRIQHHHSEMWRFRAPRTTRVFKPNIRQIKVKNTEGKIVKMNISMKYYKKLREKGYLDIKTGEKAGRYFFLPNPQK